MLADNRKRLLPALTWTAGLTTIGIFFWICSDIIIQGGRQLSWEFILSTPQQAGRAGGIWPIIIATLWILLLALLFTFVPGLACAFLLHELDQRKLFTRILVTCLDLLASMPSIVIGLFGNAFFSIMLGLGFSILSGALTLTLMMLPLFVMSVYTSLQAVDSRYQQNSYVLGLSRTTHYLRILLPLITPGIVTGIILSAGRALGETAALLFTSGYVSRMPESMMDSGRSLSIHIYDLAMNVPGGNANSYATAFVLVVLLLIINTLALQTGQRLNVLTRPTFAWKQNHV